MDCKECGHSLDSHVKTVTNKVVCLEISSGTTTGVVMAYTRRCDCLGTNRSPKSDVYMDLKLDKEAIRKTVEATLREDEKHNN